MGFGLIRTIRICPFIIKFGFSLKSDVVHRKRKISWIYSYQTYIFISKERYRERSVYSKGCWVSITILALSLRPHAFLYKKFKLENLRIKTRHSIPYVAEELHSIQFRILPDKYRILKDRIRFICMNEKIRRCAIFEFTFR
jgi:hypothetical protein